MNPLLFSALGAILRWVLAFGAGFFVERGIWSSEDAATYVAASAVALLALGWSLWSKYRGRVKLLTALAMPMGTTEATVKEHIAAGLPTPSVATPATVVPRMDP
jgi:hypothetical protein